MCSKRPRDYPPLNLRVLPLTPAISAAFKDSLMQAYATEAGGSSLAPLCSHLRASELHTGVAHLGLLLQVLES